MADGRLHVGEAQNRIVSQVKPLPGETVQLGSASGRILCEPVYSTRTIPPQDNSAMDGYAVRTADLAGASETNSVALRLTAEIPAGLMPQKRLEAGETHRIFTGGIFPEGADAVVIQENVEVSGGSPRFRQSPRPGENVRRSGEDVKPGDLVFPAGHRIASGSVALLALLGRTFVKVHRRPKVAIISTGDELVEPDADTGGWKTVNSNAWALKAALEAEGSEVIYGGIIPDQLEKIRDRVLDLRDSVDVVVSTAGVSVGDYDLVHDALTQAGLELDFWKVKQRPGAPMTFGWLKGGAASKPFFGLPGNPVSCLVCYEMYVRPAVRRMKGERAVFPPLVQAKLDGTVKTRPGITHFLRAVVSREGSGLVVSSAGIQSSAVVSALARSNGLIVVGENEETPLPGQLVNVYVTDPGALDLAETPVMP